MFNWHRFFVFPSRITRRSVHTVFVFILASLLTLLGVTLQSQPAQAVPVDFVARSGAQFTVNGSPYYFAGTNTYYLVYKPHMMVDDALQNAKDMGLKVVRTWAFLDIGNPSGGSPATIDGTKDGVYIQYWDTASNAPKINTGSNGIQMVDYMVWKAKQLGLKLILVFVNNWSAYGGMDQYVKWYSGQYHDDFYTNASVKTAFKNYMNAIVNRVNPLTNVAYKNEPAIAAWELTNEARCQGTGTSGSPAGLPTSSTCTVTTITNWISEMATYLKSSTVDPNHLVGVGDEGFFNRTSSDYYYNGGTGMDYDNNIKLANIDFGTYHLYPGTWGKTSAWATQFISDHLSSSSSADKPSIMEEFGIEDTSLPTDVQTTRNTTYDSWVNQVCSGHGNWMYWMLAARDNQGGSTFTQLYPDYDHFTVYYKDFNGNITPSGSKMASRAANTTSGSCAITPPTPTFQPPTNTPVPGSGGTNLVQNPEFDNGTVSWQLAYSNGAVASYSTVTGAGLSGTNAVKVSISSPGTANWHVQLNQGALNIVNGTTYTISFMAKADAAKAINVSLQQNISPFTSYWSQNVNVSTSAATYTYTWTANVSDANTKLNLNVGGNTTAIYLDKVNVSYVPNMIQNAEFDSGTTNWTLSLASGASATFGTVTGAGMSGTNALKVNITNGGTINWHVQVSQSGLNLQSGKTYTITFMAKADAAKTINVALQQSVSPFTTYFGQNVNITTTATIYTLTYTSTVNDPNTSIRFNVGANTIGTYIDRVNVH